MGKAEETGREEEEEMKKEEPYPLLNGFAKIVGMQKRGEWRGEEGEGRRRA